MGARFIEAGWDTYYWKDRDLEVDFVVDGPNGEKWAIEVKSAQIDASELNGLRIFLGSFFWIVPLGSGAMSFAGKIQNQT